MKDIPDEARREYVRLRELLAAAIQRRDEIKRRKESVSPKIWQMAMHNIKPELRPNLRRANLEITYIHRQMMALIRKYEEPIDLHSDVAGDPLRLKMPTARSKLSGRGIRLGSDDYDMDS